MVSNRTIELLIVISAKLIMCSSQPNNESIVLENKVNILLNIKCCVFFYTPCIVLYSHCSSHQTMHLVEIMIKNGGK